VESHVDSSNIAGRPSVVADQHHAHPTRTSVHAVAATHMSAQIEITALTKAGGPLTKRIALAPDGSLKSDGSACVMSSGTGRRMRLAGLDAFAEYIGHLAPYEAIALGMLRTDLPDQVEITTKNKLNGNARPDLIARTGDYIAYRPGRSSLALIDVDTKGMPAAIREKISAAGGFSGAIESMLPGLATTGRVARLSTSAGITRTDTGERLAGSNGQHVFIMVQDGSDIERFLRTLHERCWLHGFGWLTVGAGGQLLDRSIVDRTVGAPERLVFEAAPLLDAPLVQDQASRLPIVTKGIALDTITVCPPLTITERARLKELREKERHRLAPDAAKSRDAFISQQSKRLAKHTSMSAESAAQVIARQCRGILLPDLVLPFDDPNLAGITVGDVLADPARFEGTTLADPLEGIEYGACCARIMRRADGTPWIHSFAHGRTMYELKQDAASVEAALNKAPANEVAAAFVRLAIASELDADELEHLRGLASQRAGVGKRAIERKLNATRRELASQRAQEERDRRAAERQDPRPQIEAPEPDAPWLPQMQVLNEILGTSAAPEPPMRDVEGYVTVIRGRRVPSMHTLTAYGANDGETDETRLPPPEELLLTRLDDPQLAELIERHVDYTDASGRPVHLTAPFVKHYRQRDDNMLPIATAVATLPIVLPDGTILSVCGLDRRRSIVFRVPDELQQLLPRQVDCTPSAVAEAMRFLTDEWLVDVATDYSGKCVLLALALTIIERAALPERPAFFATAGQRGGGKTTVINMLAAAVLGRRAAASAWSPNEEERRKALFAYLGEGVALLVWDNIPRGTAISCASIEKALTAETYKDRILGVSENRTVPASTVHAFTGNNITPRGDMASRSLMARLSVNRPDPENRKFKHADPIAWTEVNRGRVLSALYTLLLGNPRLGAGAPTPAETRFKMWWHLVGSAIEYAAERHEATAFPADAKWNKDCAPNEISFRTLFLSGEVDEEQTSSLATVLDLLRHRWKDGFKASDVATFAGQASEEAIEFKAALEVASGKPLPIITPTTINWRLKAVTDAPVLLGDTAFALRYAQDKSKNGGSFTVNKVS
jgi:hypothetical protein